MNLDAVDIALITRVLSIHRTSLRKRCGRMDRGTNEHRLAVAELSETTALLNKFSECDLQAAS